MAFFGAIARESATAGVEQNNPILIPGVAKLASSAATIRSQVAANWQPAAVAIPCTSAITGNDSPRIICIACVHSANNDSRSASVASTISRRSCPALKAGPSARKITHLTSASASASSSRSMSGGMLCATGRCGVGDG